MLSYLFGFTIFHFFIASLWNIWNSQVSHNRVRHRAGQKQDISVNFIKTYKCRWLNNFSITIHFTYNFNNISSCFVKNNVRFPQKITLLLKIVSQRFENPRLLIALIVWRILRQLISNNWQCTSLFHNLDSICIEAKS